MIIESMIELYEGCRSSYEERGLKLEKGGKSYRDYVVAPRMRSVD